MPSDNRSLASAKPAAGTVVAAPQKPKKSALWIWTVRLLVWATYAIAILTIILLLHKAPPPAVQVSTQAAERVEQKLELAAKAAAAGQPATVRMDEMELNSYLATHLDIGSDNATTTVRDVKIQLVDDRMKAYVVFTRFGKDISMQLEGKLRSDRGYLRFQPLSMHVGSLSMPAWALGSAINRLTTAPQNRDKLKLPDNITSIRTEDGAVVLDYK